VRRALGKKNAKGIGLRNVFGLQIKYKWALLLYLGKLQIPNFGKCPVKIKEQKSAIFY
jgi:hypothetical protein